jgi:hypothetical protein
MYAADCLRLMRLSSSPEVKADFCTSRNCGMSLPSGRAVHRP